ncbi:hypothetical protein GQ53DRAFT_800186 [Thozetella sp. PMI_491]|nr:hypothetical protein GQ53DRAFT_800186 [Thozetella sp. PMI_491]
MRVKSGCQTCKARRVKCDETRPACSRCTSTGRVCEGYGIWGGGITINSRRPERKSPSRDIEAFVLRPPAPISVLSTSTEEKEYFDWFKVRTLHKLSGSFVSRFWNTLVLQASFQEPAILHAVLALSAVHRRGVDITAEEQPLKAIELREQDKFAINHYLQAIGHLQKHFETRNKASSRVALIACVLFIAFELFRGHFETGQCHLRNGLRVLYELSGACGDHFQRGPSHGDADDWILEAFSRFQFQVELFKLSYQGPCLTLTGEGHERPNTTFDSINGCWHELQRLINKILQLSDQCRRLRPTAEPSGQSPVLVKQQQCLQDDLNQWLYAFETLSQKFSQGRMGYEEKKGYRLLPVYHNMATIMAGMCLSPNDESAFDTYTTQFVVILGQLAELWVMVQPASHFRHSPRRHLGSFVNMAQSYVDIGWIPALYYTAVKCRVHRVRLQAIRLLECSSHREGIWDAETTACIARKVMRMEEREFYHGIDTHDEFPLSGCPTPRDLSLPLVPHSYRIKRLDAVLSGEPMDKITLFGEMEENNVYRRSVLSEYNVNTRHWTDQQEG